MKSAVECYAGTNLFQIENRSAQLGSRWMFRRSLQVFELLQINKVSDNPD